MLLARRLDPEAPPIAGPPRQRTTERIFLAIAGPRACACCLGAVALVLVVVIAELLAR